MIDVLVIGAGPTGLLMAAEVARHGLSCRIIDKEAAPAEKSRAIAIQPRTLEIFDHLGIVDPFLVEGLKIHGAHQFSGSKELAHLTFNVLDTPYPFILSLTQSETERILTEYVSSFGIKIERGVELIDLEQSDDRVKAVVCGGKETNIEAKWLVGCDGAHSLTRKALDFSFEGKTFPTLFSLADVELDWRHPHDAFYAFLNADGILIVVPMPGENRFRLIFQLERSLGAVNPESFAAPILAEVQAKVDRSIGSGVHVSHPLWLANFHVNSRLVKKYRNKRVFLAGDAAHIHSPAGGQGMNSGLQDAFNLGWKLVSGGEELLDTYTWERHSWGQKLVQATRFVTWMGTLRNPFGIFLRNLGIQTLMPWMRNRLARSIAQLSIQYPKSLIVQESGSFLGGPKAGMRAPNAPIGDTDLYSIMKKSTLPHLLFLGEEPLDGFAKQFASRKLVSLAIQDKKALQIYGVRKPSVYLIRPDQYVGRRCFLSAIEQYFPHQQPP